MADVIDGLWANQAGVNINLFASIDEAVPDDIDFIRSGLAPNLDEFEISLGNLTDPQNASGHILRLRCRKDQAGGNRIDLVISLYQGETLIAQRALSDIEASEVTYTFSLADAEAELITDYTDLRIKGKSNQIVVGGPLLYKILGTGKGGYTILIRKGASGRIIEATECGSVWYCDNIDAGDAIRAWTPASNGPGMQRDLSHKTLGDIQNLWIDPESRSHWLLLRKGGIVRTTNNGDTWLEWEFVYQVAAYRFCSADKVLGSNIIFVGSGDWRRLDISETDGRIRRSKDNGATWPNTSTQVMGANAALISLYTNAGDADSPGEERILYISGFTASTGGIYKCRWLDSNVDLTILGRVGPGGSSPANDQRFCARMAVSPTNPKRVYVATRHTVVSNGATVSGANCKIWRTLDITAAVPTWADVTPPTTLVASGNRNFKELEVIDDPSNPGQDVLFVTNQNSTDGGVLRAINAEGTPTWKHLFATGDINDRGWVSSGPNLNGQALLVEDINTITFSTVLTFPSVIFRSINANAADGVRVANQRFTYQPQAGQFEGNHNSMAIACKAMLIKPNDATRCILGYSDWYLFRSLNFTDAEPRWRKTTNQAHITFDPAFGVQDPGAGQEAHIVVTARGGFQSDPASSDDNVWESGYPGDAGDYGENWRKLDDQGVTQLPIGLVRGADFRSNGNLWVALDAASDGNNGPWIWDGATWTKKNGNMAGLNWETSGWTCRGVTFDRVNDEVYICFEQAAGGTGRIYRSTNPGAASPTWTEVGSGSRKTVPWGSCLRCHQGSGNLIIGANTGFFWASRADIVAGVANPWTKIADEFTPEWVEIGAIQALFNNQIFFLGGEQQNVSKFQNGATPKLVSLDDKMPPLRRDVHCLHYSAAGGLDRLLVAMQCSGVVRIDNP